MINWKTLSDLYEKNTKNVEQDKRKGQHIITLFLNILAPEILTEDVNEYFESGIKEFLNKIKNQNEWHDIYWNLISLEIDRKKSRYSTNYLNHHSIQFLVFFLDYVILCCSDEIQKTFFNSIREYLEQDKDPELKIEKIVKEGL